MEATSYRVRKLHVLDPVWRNPVGEEDRTIYWYSSGLSLAADGKRWAQANVIYGIVFFYPGCFGGEFVKSSGQYHPPRGETGTATPEIYSVLKGTGYFLLQKARPPYTTIADAVLVKVREGESFIVPPDYGHLQINPAREPLIFSYVVMDGLDGVYEPFRERRGALYYVMDDPERPFEANSRYENPVPLRVLRASDLAQHALLREPITYGRVLESLDELRFITRPELFPAEAELKEDAR
jgi:glucose-6-phosphate isomerase